MVPSALHIARSSAPALNASCARFEPEREERKVAKSLTEALNEAARAAVEVSDLERDQEAWNLPRAPRESIARADEDEGDALESDAGERGADSPARPPETTG